VLLVYHGMADAYRTMLAERLPGLDVVAVSTEEALERHIGDAEILLAWRFPLHVLARAGGSAGSSSPAPGRTHPRARRTARRRTNARGIHAGPMATT
jgi:hypothetical protein